MFQPDEPLELFDIPRVDVAARLPFHADQVRLGCRRVHRPANSKPRQLQGLKSDRRRNDHVNLIPAGSPPEIDRFEIFAPHPFGARSRIGKTHRIDRYFDGKPTGLQNGNRVPYVFVAHFKNDVEVGRHADIPVQVDGHAANHGEFDPGTVKTPNDVRAEQLLLPRIPDELRRRLQPVENLIRRPIQVSHKLRLPRLPPAKIDHPTPLVHHRLAQIHK